MSTNLYDGRIQVHPSGAIEVTGQAESRNGVKRSTSIYLTDEAVDELKRTFEFQRLYCDHLGHAYWHIRNNQPKPCDLCYLLQDG